MKVKSIKDFLDQFDDETEINIEVDITYIDEDAADCAPHLIDHIGCSFTTIDSQGYKREFML